MLTRQTSLLHPVRLPPTSHPLCFRGGVVRTFGGFGSSGTAGVPLFQGREGGHGACHRIQEEAPSIGRREAAEGLISLMGPVIGCNKLEDM